LSFSSVSFSFVSHCPLACRDTRPLHSSAFRLVRSLAASFVEPPAASSAHSHRHSHRLSRIRPTPPPPIQPAAHPLRWPIRPCRNRGSRCRRIRQYTTRQRKISKREIRVRSDSSERCGGDQWKRLPIGPARCVRMTQLCCRCCAVRVVAACGCCALVFIRAVILNTGILQALSE